MYWARKKVFMIFACFSFEVFWTVLWRERATWEEVGRTVEWVQSEWDCWSRRMTVAGGQMMTSWQLLALKRSCMKWTHLIGWNAAPSVPSQGWWSEKGCNRRPTQHRSVQNKRSSSSSWRPSSLSSSAAPGHTGSTSMNTLQPKARTDPRTRCKLNPAAANYSAQFGQHAI